MAKHQGISGINLLPKDSFEFSTTGKILKWVTTAGRALVVITEFVVLLAFGSRFYFDKKLDDLKETIIQKEAQIKAYAEVESDIRRVLAKQQPIETAQKTGLDFSDKIQKMTQTMPQGTFLETLSLNDDGLAMQGVAQSEYVFAQFLNGVKKIPQVSQVSLKNTSFDQVTGGVKFSIQLVYK